MKNEPQLEIVILAAGKGTRMQSGIPKVLHPLAGKSLIQHVIDTARLLNPQNIHIVIGHGAEQVQSAIDNEDLNWVEQQQQLGTAHAVKQVIPYLHKDSDVLILYGDVPLISTTTLQQMREKKQGAELLLLTCEMQQPDGYGRIVRDDNDKIQAIVEQKDADKQILGIREVNSGIMLLGSSKLGEWLQQVDNHNSQNEYYLTDIVALAVKEEARVDAVICKNQREIEGVNNKKQLAELERYYQLQQAYYLMEKGVTLRDPARLDIRGSLQTGRDVEIDINVIFKGDCHLGDGVKIGANCVIRNSVIGDHVIVYDNTLIEDSIIAQDCHIGPFSRLRPGSKLQKAAKIGNYVEIKNATIGEGSKVNHLSYIGDTLMGHAVNIGAGTITCNYDGANKHQTIIGDAVFVGSNTALVAPIHIAKEVTIAAGTTLSKNIEDKCLVVARPKAREIKNWKRPEKS